MRRALVSLPDGVWKIIDEQLKGVIGDGDSEVIRNIVIAHLTAKGYLLEPKGKRAGGIPRQLDEEIAMHDKMMASLVEILEEKGTLTYDEWEKRIRKKISEASGESTS